MKFSFYGNIYIYIINIYIYIYIYKYKYKKRPKKKKIQAKEKEQPSYLITSLVSEITITLSIIYKVKNLSRQKYKTDSIK